MENNGSQTGPFMDLLNLISEEEIEKIEKDTRPRDSQGRRNVIGGPNCL